MKVRLEPGALAVGTTRVDVNAPDAVAKMLGILGAFRQTTVAGVDGSGRVAHWLESGVVVVTQRDDAELVMLWFCFDQEQSVYPQRVSRPALFRGSLSIVGNELSAATPQSALGKWPGLVGFPALRGGGDRGVGRRQGIPAARRDATKGLSSRMSPFSRTAT